MIYYVSDEERTNIKAIAKQQGLSIAGMMRMIANGMLRVVR